MPPGSSSRRDGPPSGCSASSRSDPIPEAFLADLARSRRLLVVEEHVAQGGVGQMIAGALLAGGIALDRFATRSAQGYVSGRYGSQKFHRRECGLDPESIVQFLTAEDA